jgi:hypothetical protein
VILISPNGSRVLGELPEDGGSELFVIELYPPIMAKDAKKETFNLQYLLTRNVIVNLKKREMCPVVLCFIMTFDSCPDAGIGFFRDAAHADVKDLVHFLSETPGSLHIKDVNSASNVRNSPPFASPHVETASLDQPQWSLLWHWVAEANRNPFSIRLNCPSTPISPNQ